MTDFKSLGLIEAVHKAVAKVGYTEPSPIQAQAIPTLLEGRDLLGIAQTGTGKTAAFVLPILHRLVKANILPARKTPRVLILAPTRELALQIQESIESYARFTEVRAIVVFGGVPINKHIKALNAGAQIVVATPGRLLDLMNQDKVRLNKIETLVLDEADRMLDMGFVNDVKKVCAAVPDKRQTLLFSATMPDNVQSLANGLLNNPARVEVAPPATTAERVQQRVLMVPKDKKRTLLSHIFADEAYSKVLVFTRTKHGADRVARHLDRAGISSGAIHGDKPQGARQRVLKGFKAGNLRALVATDIAARGIDVDGVTHVINFDLPNEPESYVHRIGRTARGGEQGEAISFCDAQERGYLRDIEVAIRQAVPLDDSHIFHAEAIAQPDEDPPKRGQRRAGGGRPGGRGAPRASAPKSKAKKAKGHRPTDGKRHGDKGHGGHGHSENQGASAKNHGAKKTGQQKKNAKRGAKRAVKRAR
ncbi:DEAD/DEAH box helicase [Magnetovibrio sp. PR-2]|uniref:DEAD/DEAH box helicase n=1 Tax=Magnetovibrio sp. PR-2 TaxID=3120356 RepID=UPI002FCDE978